MFETDWKLIIKFWDRFANRMFLKVIFLLVSSILAFISCRNQAEFETALCIVKPTACPSIKQRKGVCCKRSIDQDHKYYSNSCVACKAVSFFLFRVAMSTCLKRMTPRIVMLLTSMRICETFDKKSVQFADYDFCDWSICRKW